MCPVLEMDPGDRSALLGELHADTIRAVGNLFKLAIEASPAGVLVAGPDGSIALVNHVLEQQFGYENDELIGKPVEVLLPESLRSVHLEHRLAYMTNPQTRPMGAGRELFGRRKDGSRIPIEIALNVVPTISGQFVLASVIEITESCRIEQQRLRELTERSEFDRLIGEISNGFISVPPEQIDQAIKTALRQVAEALNLDRCTLFHISEGGADFVLTHHWERSPDVVPPLCLSVKEQFSWSFAKICNGELAYFSTIDEVPDGTERETLRYYGTKSRLSVPMWIGGEVRGVMGFASTRQQRAWPEAILSRLRLVGQVFANVIARKDADLVLRGSEERFRMIADNSPIMIWVSGRDKICTWFNRRWLEFVGQTLEHELGDGWAQGVHPDDLEPCLQLYRKAFDARQPFSMEYRLLRHDGEWRWVLDRGMPIYVSEGTFEGCIGSCIDITDQKRARLQLEGALVEVEIQRQELQSENMYLRREVHGRLGSGSVVGRSAAIRSVLDQIKQVAQTDSTVLLLGETGTGKELFATQVHEQSARRTHTMVRVNCAAIPAPLIESELFGREKGAYTGALTRQTGRFELADKSTIFLDEIGDLPQDVQVKLLRVLEERQIQRLGSTKEIHVDTRIVAATHRNLEQLVKEGSFREDLFYRLNVFPVQVPPLRERIEDIPFLVWHFVGEFSKAFGKRVDAVSRDNMVALQAYSWPGNVRELRNVVERAMIVATSPHLTIRIPAHSTAAGKHSIALEDVEREHILGVLESTGWRIRGPAGAAGRLGLKPTTLETRMAKLGISRPRES